VSCTILLVAGARAGAEIVRATLPDAVVLTAERDSAELTASIVDADVVVGSHLTADELGHAQRLKLVQVFGTGYDGIAIEALPAGCTLCNVQEHDIAIAEWSLMAMLALARRLLPTDRDFRRGVWGDAYRFEGTPTPDLRGRTLGTVGAGTIAAEIIRLGQAIGMNAVAVTRTPTAARERDLNVSWLRGLDALTDLFTEADFVVIAVPLNDETRGLIGAREFEALGPSGYLLNVGRGPVVEEEALYHALVSGTIAGAGLDVWYRYPTAVDEVTLPASFPFWELDNVLMTPHISGFSESTFNRRWEFIAKQILRVAEDQPLENVVAAR
jgi:phosphoglycerate dehydrogenase-like enzyme